MKKHSCFKMLCSTLVGLTGVVATTTALAVDIGAPVLETWHPRTMVARSPALNQAPALKINSTVSRGAQGPIRTDDFSEQKAKVDGEMVRSDLQMNRYPMSNGVSIP